MAAQTLNYVMLARIFHDGAYATSMLRCLLYTSDAADERSSVDLGGRRFITKKKQKKNTHTLALTKQHEATRTSSQTI